jgi:hypothetical protein
MISFEMEIDFAPPMETSFVLGPSDARLLLTKLRFGPTVVFSISSPLDP